MSKPTVKVEDAGIKGEDELDALFDEGELERILNSEASQVQREAEVMRVVKAFKLNPYEILDLNWMPSAGVTDSDIQKTYRKKSLLIHPDKLKHDRGIEAFDLLKKATTELADEKKKIALDQTIADARMLILREMKLLPTVPDDDDRLKSLKDPDLKERVRLKTKELLIEDELRRRRVTKMTMIAEGAEAKRQEDAIEKRKRKMEDDKKWEDTREDRVSGWRSFQKGPKKKKKGNNPTRFFRYSLTVAVPQAVYNYLRAVYPTLELEPQWINDCYEYLQEHFPGLTTHELSKKVEYQLLASNLATSTVSTDRLLPQFGDEDDQDERVRVLFQGGKRHAVLVQVMQVEDVSHPALEQLDVLKEKREVRRRLEIKEEAGLHHDRLPVQNRNGANLRQPGNGEYEVHEGEDEAKTWKRGMMKLRLSDGHREIQAIELLQIPGLGLEEIKLGCKLLIHSVQVMRNVLLLTPASVIMKGNSVEEMEREAELDLEDTLRRRLNLPLLPREPAQELKADDQHPRPQPEPKPELHAAPVPQRQLAATADRKALLAPPQPSVKAPIKVPTASTSATSQRPPQRNGLPPKTATEFDEFDDDGDMDFEFDEDAEEALRAVEAQARAKQAAAAAAAASTSQRKKPIVARPDSTVARPDSTVAKRPMYIDVSDSEDGDSKPVQRPAQKVRLGSASNGKTLNPVVSLNGSAGVLDLSSSDEVKSSKVKRTTSRRIGVGEKRGVVQEILLLDDDDDD